MFIQVLIQVISVHLIKKSKDNNGDMPTIPSIQKERFSEKHLVRLTRQNGGCCGILVEQQASPRS